MDIIKMKKEFQAVVKQIRDSLNHGVERKSEYPKAMMTGQQIKKRTATIRVAEHRKDCFISLQADFCRAAAIAADSRFKIFCAKYNAKVKIESVNRDMYTTTQIRLTY